MYETARAIKSLAMQKYIHYAIKTEGAYNRQLRRSVRDFYTEETDAFQFIDEMVAMIDNQFNRAFREGAREAGVDPRDFTDRDLQWVKDRISQEHNHVLGYATAIDDARINQSGTDALYIRADMWTRRYEEIKNDAKLRFSEGKLEWIYGDTDHCATCAGLNGIVASVQEWQASKYKPQHAPNPELECGGWRCQCQLAQTDKPKTRGGIPE